MRCLRCWSTWVGAAFLHLVSPVQAHAIDCANPSDAFDRMVCASPGAKSAADAMRSASDAVQRHLSENGRKTLSEGQRQWDLALRNVFCPLDRSHMSSVAECAEFQLSRRADELLRRNGPKGNFVFVSRETLRYWRVPPDEQGRPASGFFHESVADPLIDGATDPSEVKFGEALRTICPEEYEEGGICGPGYHSLNAGTVVSADPDLVQVWRQSWTGRRSNSRMQHYALSLARIVAEDDVFDRAKPWHDELAAIYIDELRSHPLVSERVARERPDELLRNYGPGTISAWHFRPDALVVVQLKWSDPVRDRVPDIAIPWAKLRHLLREPLPFQLPQ